MDIDKKKIKEYIDQLSKLNDFISNSDEENIDINEMNDFNDKLNNVLQALNNDISPKIEDIYEAPIEIKIKKLHPNAIIPKYKNIGDAGMDLTITSIIEETSNDITYGYGISIEIPEGYIGLVFPRSSIRNYALLLTNCVGVIDSGYRGEIISTFKKISPDWDWVDSNNIILPKIYNIGDRSAQIIILPYPKIKFIESESLSGTERGDGGFGSTGK
jgi:dUTP pyrophosphatase